MFYAAQPHYLWESLPKYQRLQRKTQCFYIHFPAVSNSKEGFYLKKKAFLRVHFCPKFHSTILRSWKFKSFILRNRRHRYEAGNSDRPDPSAPWQIGLCNMSGTFSFLLQDQWSQIWHLGCRHQNLKGAGAHTRGFTEIWGWYSSNQYSVKFFLNVSQFIVIF